MSFWRIRPAPRRARTCLLQRRRYGVGSDPVQEIRQRANSTRGVGFNRESKVSGIIRADQLGRESSSSQGHG